MAEEENSKLQYIIWWIASIAVSVLCCAALFVVFASSLVDVRADIKDANMRINAAEQRQNQIIPEVMTMRKHINAAPSAQPASVPPASPPAAVPAAAPPSK